MGQGYSAVTLPIGPSAIETSELSDLSFEKSLGGARFLKTVRARHQNGIVVAKICTKSNANVSFQEYVKAIKKERRLLKDIPNVLPFARVRETNTLGVLVRQFVHQSLYDRMSIRPFLEDVEKKWIAFQLLCAVNDCHNRGVFHGDIKSENVLVTSWGWVYLTDFASTYKPVYLPEDNPADFSFFYDSSARRTCYIAPERFLAAGEQPSEGNIVQWNMDVFSVGCVLAELFTEAPTFTLSQMFRYRKGDYDPTVALFNKVKEDQVRTMITSMIRLDPGGRWHPDDYLQEFKGKAFPLYFYNHLHTLTQEITDPSSGRESINNGDGNNDQSDERIDRIYEDFEMLSVSLGYQDSPGLHAIASPEPAYLERLFPLQVDLPNSRHTAHSPDTNIADNGTFILLNVVTASVRSCARASTKLRACELLLAFAERLPDEAKLDRVLPYVMPLLDDPNEMVLVAALRTMTQLLALVKVVSPVNSFLFTQFIFPKLQLFTKSKCFAQNTLVRATYAACLATLAETASRFLDIMQALKVEDSLPSADKDIETGGDNYAVADAYDDTRRDMLEQFEGQTKVFLTDTNNAVRRAFLSSVSSLCVFFGEARSADVILSHLNTYLNDPDWLLKCAFFKTIVGIAVYIGGANVEDFILPLMLQALTDPQEFVVEQALRSLATMAEMGLLQRAKTWELIDTVARFSMHPNIWIKEAASHFISAATTYVSTADIRILVAPLIQPYLKIAVASLSESELLDALKKPLPRTVLELASQWAGRVDRSAFWKTARDSRQLSYASTGQMPPQSSVADLGPKALAKVPKTDEDEQWLGRLRNAGMKSEDEMKILAFREYLWRSAQRAKRGNDESTGIDYEQIVNLSRLKIQLQTVIFDTDVQAYDQRVEEQNRTIAEALEEASKVESKSRADNNEAPEDSSTETSGVDRSSHVPGPASRAIRRLSGLRQEASGSLSSSPSSGIGLLGREVDHTLRQRGHATGLLGGADIRSKAQAAVATDSATAEGQLDRPRSGSRKPSSLPERGLQRKGLERAPSNRAGHNYTGNDPTILKLLDTVYIDSFPADAADFGPFVQPAEGVIPINVNQVPTSTWRPQGRSVAVLGEHTARVSRIVVSPDHVFFLTASDDGSIKIWDTSRLERNVTYRSRQSYKLPGGFKFTGLCFIEDTHSFVCAGADGSITVVRVTVTESDKTLRYGKLQIVREWQVPTTCPSGEHAVWIEHFRGESTSTLVLVTNLGRLLGLDLRYMSVIFDLQNPQQHGVPTTFCIGRRHDWVLIGTSHGILDLWDIRFQLRVRSWTFANAAPITRLQLHPSKKSSKRNKFCVSGGTAPGEMTVWDTEKGICHEIICPAHAHSKDRLHLRDYELRNMDDQKGDGQLERIAGVTAGESVAESHNTTVSTVTFFGAQPSPKDSEAQHPFAISGGPDGKVRFWDMERLDGCRLVNGGAPDEKPSYTFSQLNLDTKVLSEVPADTPSPTGALESNKVAPGSSSKKAAVSATGKPTSRYETIRMSSQNLMSGHLDTITDVAMLERPFGMILSADRSGQVFICQ